MKLTKEAKERNEARRGLLQELIAIRDERTGKVPGQPCVEIKLEKVLTFEGENGEHRAVMELSELIYLVEQVLRRED